MKALSSKVHHLVATDVDELTERAHCLKWQLDYVQLERGSFQADILSYSCQNVQMIRTQYSRGIRCFGQSPLGKMAIVLPLSPPDVWSWHGYELSPEQFLLQTVNQGVDHCRWGTFPLAVVLFSLDELLTIADSMEETIAIERLLGNDFVFHPPLPPLKEMRQFLAGTFQTLAQQKERGLGLSSQCQTLLCQALTLQALSLLAAPSPLVKPLSRYSLVKQAETLIRENSDRPLTVYDLCTQLHVSERTLRYGFREVFGIGPKAYLQNYRLHRARECLKSSSRQEITVMAIAHQWGFWHLGQFSQDYKKMFGELPSVTLRRPYNFADF